MAYPTTKIQKYLLFLTSAALNPSSSTKGLTASVSFLDSSTSLGKRIKNKITGKLTIKERSPNMIYDAEGPLVANDCEVNCCKKILPIDPPEKAIPNAFPRPLFGNQLLIT